MTRTDTLWGDDQTRYFFELTPERVLEAVETLGIRCTGRCQALNSFENRVYDLELEEPLSEAGCAEPPGGFPPAGSPSSRHCVAKFYRPGRWSREQILEEHEFLLDLQEAEIPVIGPLLFSSRDGRNGPGSLHEGVSGIRFALFPRVGGRAPDELSDEQLLRIGRLLGRIHNVGAAKEAKHRLRLGPDTYGAANLKFLLERNFIPLEFAARYEAAVRAVVGLAEKLFQGVPIHRIHGDCHLGNLLWNQQGPFFLDFDDTVRGPAVQDLWLLTPGRDPQALRQREVLIEGYSEMRSFDRSSLRLVEILRALRFIHYSAWIARRWEDPAFPAAFPHFGTHRYWQTETADLEEQLRLSS